MKHWTFIDNENCIYVSSIRHVVVNHLGYVAVIVVGLLLILIRQQTFVIGSATCVVIVFSVVGAGGVGSNPTQFVAAWSVSLILFAMLMWKSRLDAQLKTAQDVQQYEAAFDKVRGQRSSDGRGHSRQVHPETRSRSDDTVRDDLRSIREQCLQARTVYTHTHTHISN